MSYPNVAFDYWQDAVTRAQLWAFEYQQRYQVWRAKDGRWVACPQIPLNKNRIGIL